MKPLAEMREAAAEAEACRVAGERVAAAIKLLEQAACTPGLHNDLANLTLSLTRGARTLATDMHKDETHAAERADIHASVAT